VDLIYVVCESAAALGAIPVLIRRLLFFWIPFSFAVPLFCGGVSFFPSILAVPASMELS
jgi:hypothetical protein